MLCAKYIKALCYIENIETSCAKCTNIMRKIHKCYAQNADTSWSKCGNVLKMRKRYAQNAETLCSKCGNVILKMQRQNAESYKVCMSSTLNLTEVQQYGSLNAVMQSKYVME